jgi:hypothetical protein
MNIAKILTTHSPPLLQENRIKNPLLELKANLFHSKLSGFSVKMEIIQLAAQT